MGTNPNPPKGTIPTPSPNPPKFPNPPSKLPKTGAPSQSPPREGSPGPTLTPLPRGTPRGHPGTPRPHSPVPPGRDGPRTPEGPPASQPGSPRGAPGGGGSERPGPPPTGPRCRKRRPPAGSCGRAAGVGRRSLPAPPAPERPRLGLAPPSLTGRGRRRLRPAHGAIFLRRAPPCFARPPRGFGPIAARLRSALANRW